MSKIIIKIISFISFELSCRALYNGDKMIGLELSVSMIIHIQSVLRVFMAGTWGGMDQLDSHGMNERVLIAITVPV